MACRSARAACRASSPAMASPAKRGGLHKRAGQAGRSGGAPGLVRRPARLRPGPDHLPGRDRGHHYHGAAPRLGTLRRALPPGCAARTPPHHHAHRRPAHHGPGRHCPIRGRYKRRALLWLRGGHPGPGAPARRHRGAGHLPVHKVIGIREAVEAAGARLLFLPPYSPVFNPIENAFAKLKALLRTAAARTVGDLNAAIHDALAHFTPYECRNYVTAAGYETDAAVST